VEVGISLQTIINLVLDLQEEVLPRNATIVGKKVTSAKNALNLVENDHPIAEKENHIHLLHGTTISLLLGITLLQIRAGATILLQAIPTGVQIRMPLAINNGLLKVSLDGAMLLNNRVGEMHLSRMGIILHKVGAIHLRINKDGEMLTMHKANLDGEVVNKDGVMKDPLMNNHPGIKVAQLVS
jgi:hypothetical protein